MDNQFEKRAEIIKNLGVNAKKASNKLAKINNQKKNEVCAMNWGMYATSSINRRLKKQNLFNFHNNLYVSSFNIFPPKMVWYIISISK